MFYRAFDSALRTRACARWTLLPRRCPPFQDGPMLCVLVHLIVLGVLLLATPVEAAHRPPNVVLILTDNQGAWTLGCYGNPDIRTPNIDRLAREGMLLDRCFSSNAVCSPTRATLLTGLIPSQHGVHSYLTAG